MAFVSQVNPSPAWIRKESKLSVRKQCQLLHLNRSTIYYDPKEPTEEERLYREELMGRLDILHTKHPTYGSRKLVIMMQREGYEIGRKLVRKLMQEMGLYTIYPKENLSKRNFKEAIVPYLLRNRLIQFPNEVWSIDITFIKLYDTHMYLTAIIDWYSRKIMGWRLSDTLETTEVLEAVKEAVKKHGAPAIINSDQGSQFTSTEYKALLKELQIRQSMDGKSRWADNIMIERWFRSLKTDLIYINEFHSPRELRQEIEKYVQEYNTVRPHQSLGNATPEAVFQVCFQISA